MFGGNVPCIMRTPLFSHIILEKEGTLYTSKYGTFKIIVLKIYELPYTHIVYFILYLL